MYALLIDSTAKEGFRLEKTAYQKSDTFSIGLCFMPAIGSVTIRQNRFRKLFMEITATGGAEPKFP